MRDLKLVIRVVRSWEERDTILLLLLLYEWWEWMDGWIQQGNFVVAEFVEMLMNTVYSRLIFVVIDRILLFTGNPHSFTDKTVSGLQTKHTV